MTITAQFPPTLLHTGNYNLKYIYCRHYHQSVLCSPLRNRVDPVRELSDDISVINHARNLAKQATPMGLGAKLGRVLVLSKEKEREKERERERERESQFTNWITLSPRLLRTVGDIYLCWQLPTARRVNLDSVTYCIIQGYIRRGSLQVHGAA